MSFISNEFRKAVQCVCMDLYVQKLTYDLVDGIVCFVAVDEDDEYEWCVPMLELFGLDTTQMINLIVDAFRVKYNKVGV